jgi:hypothetical protein
VTPDLTGTNKSLSNRIKRYQEIQVEVTEGARNLCRRLGKNQITLPIQATGKSQPNREQRKFSEHAETRLNLSTASLLMIADDLVGEVYSRYKLTDEILLLYQQDRREKPTHAHWGCGDVSSCLWQGRILILMEKKRMQNPATIVESLQEG